MQRRYRSTPSWTSIACHSWSTTAGSTIPQIVVQVVGAAPALAAEVVVMLPRYHDRSGTRAQSLSAGQRCFTPEARACCWQRGVVVISGPGDRASDSYSWRRGRRGLRRSCPGSISIRAGVQRALGAPRSPAVPTSSRGPPRCPLRRGARDGPTARPRARASRAPVADPPSPEKPSSPSPATVVMKPLGLTRRT